MRSLIAVAFLASALFTQRPPADPQLGARMSFITLQAANVTFDGRIVVFAGDPPPAHNDTRGLHGSGPVDTGKMVFFRGDFAGHRDGLAGWHPPSRTWRTYGMADLADAAGWSGRERPADRVSDGITGLAGTSDQVWMGTNGLGIIMLDVRTWQWSRYDVQARPERGRHNWVHYADDDYVFVSGGSRTGAAPTGNPELSMPGLEVYSVKRNAWVRIDAVPRANVISFATNHGLSVSVPCSQAGYAQMPYVPLSECAVYHPERVTRIRDGAAYEFEHPFPAPGVSGRYILTRQQLDAAIGRLGR